MAEGAPIINILTHGLPRDLSRPIYNEFQDRIKDANYYIDNYEKYGVLKPYPDTLELLLALSIFHKRVISNLDAAVKFYGTVATHSASDVICVGNYKLTSDERLKIDALLTNYRKIMRRYCLADRLWDYDQTKEFLATLLDLLNLEKLDNQEQ